MKLIARPTRAIFVVGNMDGSLTVSQDVRLPELRDCVAGVSNLPSSAVETFMAWLSATRVRQVGDSYEVCDDSGDVVALVVLT